MALDALSRVTDFDVDRVYDDTVREDIKKRPISAVAKWVGEVYDKYLNGPGLLNVLNIRSFGPLVENSTRLHSRGYNSAARDSYTKLAQKYFFFIGASFSFPALIETVSKVVAKVFNCNLEGVIHTSHSINSLGIFSRVCAIAGIFGSLIGFCFEANGIKRAVLFTQHKIFQEVNQKSGISYEQERNLNAFNHYKEAITELKLAYCDLDGEIHQRLYNSINPKVIALFQRMGSEKMTKEMHDRIIKLSIEAENIVRISSPTVKAEKMKKFIEDAKALKNDLSIQIKKKMIVHLLGMLSSALMIASCIITLFFPPLALAATILMVLSMVVVLVRYSVYSGLMGQVGWKFCSAKEFLDNLKMDFIPQFILDIPQDLKSLKNRTARKIGMLRTKISDGLLNLWKKTPKEERFILSGDGRVTKV